MQNTQFDFISVYGLFLNHLSRYKKIFFSFILLGVIIGFYNLFTKPTVQYGEFIVRMGDPTDPNIADMILVFDQYALMSGLDKNLFSTVEEYEELLGDLKAFSSIELSTLNRSNFKVIVSFADSNLFVNSPEEVVLKAFQNNKVISDYIHAQEVLLNREIALINEAIQSRSKLEWGKDVENINASDYLVSRFALSDMGSLSQQRLNFELMKRRLTNFSIVSKIEYQSVKVLMIRHFILNTLVIVFIGFLVSLFMALHHSYKARKS